MKGRCIFMSYLNKKTLRDIDVEQKIVFVRCDFNVPLDNGTIADDKRIIESLKTLKYLVEKKAKIIACSHLGRPKDGFNMEFSLKPVADRLAKLIDTKVIMSSDVIGEDTFKKINDLNPGEILLLENIRFHKEEKKNDREFAKKLASMADIYVNDAFGTAHRAHASTAGIAEFLPAVSGFLIEKEISFMGEALANPKRPFVAILGGSKVSDKISVIENLLDKVDTLIIGGGMAYTFNKSKGYKIGTSICEDDKLDLAKSLLKKAEEKGVKILLPVDNMVGDDFNPNCNAKLVDSDKIPDEYTGLDIGTKTQEIFAEEISHAKTVIWNGPMGVAEWDRFAIGTISIAQALSDNKDCVSIIGGGDSAAAVEKLGFADKMDHISTGGGASLEFLEGKVLPGIAALMNK